MDESLLCGLIGKQVSKVVVDHGDTHVYGVYLAFTDGSSISIKACDNMSAHIDVEAAVFTKITL